MGAFRKDDGLYSKEEACICLNCQQAKCIGKCERLKREKKRIHKEKSKEAHAHDKGAAAELSKN